MGLHRGGNPIVLLSLSLSLHPMWGVTPCCHMGVTVVAFITPHPTPAPPTPACIQSKRLHHVLYLDGEEEWLDLSNEKVEWLRATRGGALSTGHFLSSEWLDCRTMCAIALR
jgi:hypothetical protein